MSTINLADVKVSYEGQELPAVNLILKLQAQLQELACRMATIADTLGNLQTALLNSATVEVKLTLSREDLSKFRSLGGVDDNERIRKAVIALINSEDFEIPKSSAESKPSSTSKASKNVDSQAECASPEQPAAAEPTSKKKLTTTCPICHYVIELPGATKDKLSVEVKCENCGAKSLLKTKNI